MLEFKKEKKADHCILCLLPPNFYNKMKMEGEEGGR